MAYSVRPTADGGFIVGGYDGLGQARDLLVVKIDSTGGQEWQNTYGSVWYEWAAYVEQLPDGRYIMAAGDRTGLTTGPRPSMYLLDSLGAVVWHVLYDVATAWSTLWTVPVIAPNGDFVAGGFEMNGNRAIGLLMRTDSLGNLRWRRHYQTLDINDNMFFDVALSLDEGFILAGTAYDSVPVVNLAAWLIKTDSFGCLVPGCQVFDGVLEQITDLTGALTLAPNPASGSVEVKIDLPPGTVHGNALKLGLVDAHGRLVHEEHVTVNERSHLLNLSPYPTGLYFVHLLDGHRWLAGTKLVKQ